MLLSQSCSRSPTSQLRQTLTQTSRAVRNSYFDLVNAIAGLEVAQQSLELTQTSLRNNQRRVDVGTMAPIDIVQAQAEVAANEESVIVAEGQIRDRRGSAAHAGDEPLAAGLLDHAARALGAADADAAADRHGRGDQERAGEPHRPGAAAQGRSIRPTSA